MTQRTSIPVEQIDFSETVMPEPTPIEYTDEQVLAQLAQTEGWKKVTDYVKSRVEFYQNYLPSGKPLAEATEQELIIGWKTAVNIIQEFDNLTGQVEAAKNAIKARQQ